MAIVICEACKGEGVQSRRDRYEGTQYIRCPMCKGQRVQREIISRTYEQVQPVNAPDSYSAYNDPPRQK